jgi:ABC-2 type transport system permease protein
VIFGSIPSFSEPSAGLGGETPFNAYIPILIAFVIAGLAFFSLPGALSSYRELGILRRLSTTPLPPPWVLAAQLVINVAIAVAAVVIVVVAGITAYGAATPRNPGAMVLAILITMASLLAIGLWISSFARTARIGNALGAALFYPLMFFAGLWVPRAAMPSVLRDISNYTPLGAAVEAVQQAIQQGTVSWVALLVMIGYAVVFGALAVRFFRWE